jgi:hypothetical protein
MARFYWTHNRCQGFSFPRTYWTGFPKTMCAIMFEIGGMLNLAIFQQLPEKSDLGRSGLDPRIMLALLLYSYCQGERSSCRSERTVAHARCSVSGGVGSALYGPQLNRLVLEDLRDCSGDFFLKILMVCQC